MCLEKESKLICIILRPINLTVLGYVEHSEPSPIWKHALGDYDDTFRCDYNFQNIMCF